MAQKQTHTRARPIRIPPEDWADFGALVGDRERSQLIREFVAWYLRRPKAALPKRPTEEDVLRALAAKPAESDD